VINTSRFITIYIIYLIICVLFFYLGIKIIKRNPKSHLNRILSTFYIITSIALIINFIYPLITDPALQDLINIMNILVIYLICLALGFLLLFIFILYRPYSLISTKKQKIFILLYGLICLGLFFIPKGVEVRILSDGTQNPPVWSFQFTAYVLVLILSTMILLIFTCLKIFKTFKSKILVKRIKYFLVGILIFYYIAIGAAISNYLNIEIIREIYTISGFSVIIGAIFLYYSVGYSLRKQFPIGL